MPWNQRLRFSEEFRQSKKFQKRRRLSAGHQPIVHREKRIKLFWPLDPSLKNKFKKPENLTIVTAHNYPEKSIFEQSLDFLGITDYVVLSEPIKTEWRHTYKTKWVLKFLQSGECKTKYLLFCDARDTVLIDDPQKILDIFKTMNCELIFNATLRKKCIYWIMPQLLDWTKTISKKHGRYLNSGAFIGKTEFIQQFLESAVTLIGRLYPPFSDQEIFRYLHPAFYPEVDIDYSNDIFYRN